MSEGVILKGTGGFYTVQTAEGRAVCRARGRFRLEKTSPMPGDRVKIVSLSDGVGWIAEILERRNAFIRPPICNIDALVIVASEAAPYGDPFLIDCMTVIAASHGSEAIICLNKSDMASGGELYDIYSSAGFRCVRVSALTGDGLSGLEDAISGKTAAFAGVSGVGKSTLLNALDPGIERETGEISKKLGRGRHTTRHVELFAMPCGAIAADTPGFSAIDATDGLEKERLAGCFIEFEPYLDKCRFSGCLHAGVLDCAVYNAVLEGKISPSRYGSYKMLLEGYNARNRS